MEIKKEPVRILRVLMAALMAEFIPLIILVAVLTVWGVSAAPGQGQAVYEAFARQAGEYINPIVGPLAALAFGFWAARKPWHNHVLHGFLTGLLVAILDIIIMVLTSAEFDAIDIITLLAKIAAGTIGGYLAKRRYENLPADQRESHRLI